MNNLDGPKLAGHRKIGVQGPGREFQNLWGAFRAGPYDEEHCVLGGNDGITSGNPQQPCMTIRYPNPWKFMRP